MDKLKYSTFRDFWEKGFSLTAGGKFGGHFLVYPGTILCPIIIHFADTGLSTKQYLKWRGLVDAIPNDIKKSKSKHHDYDNDISLFMNQVKIYLKDISTKKSYEYLTDRKVIIKTSAMEHLSQCYNISSEEWKQLFILPINCTYERKLHEFQYKLLHNCLTLNPYLFKIDIYSVP